MPRKFLLILHAMRDLFMAVNYLEVQINHIEKPIHVLVFGKTPWAYSLIDNLNGKITKKKKKGTTCLLLVPLIISLSKTKSDLVVVRISELWTYHLPKGWVSIPEWIGFRKKQDFTFCRLASSNLLSRQARKDIRRMQRSRFQHSISYSIEDFKYFYYFLYLPYMKMKFKEQACIQRYHALLAKFKQGGLIFIHNGKQKIAGILYSFKKVIEINVIGIAEEYYGSIKDGLIIALYYHALTLAKQYNKEFIYLGISRAFTHDGVFRFKHKWGMELFKDPRNMYYTVTCIARKIEKQIFAKAPFVCFEKDELRVALFINDSGEYTVKQGKDFYEKYLSLGADSLKIGFCNSDIEILQKYPMSDLM